MGEGVGDPEGLAVARHDDAGDALLPLRLPGGRGMTGDRGLAGEQPAVVVEAVDDPIGRPPS